MTGAGKAKPFPAAPALAQRVLDPGFTPRVADIDSILGLLADDTLASGAERAIARVRSSALPALVLKLESALPPVRGRIVRIIGRIAARDHSAGAIDVLFHALDDRDPKTRRNAAIALGHVRGERIEEVLLRAWSRDERPEMRRSLAASLGKVGSSRALDVLRDASHAEDRDLARIADRAIMMIERTASRPISGHGSQIATARLAPRPIDIVALCRRGLEEILAEELEGVSAVTDVLIEIPGQVRARLHGSLQALFAARTMLGFQFPLPPQRLDEDRPTEHALAQAVGSESARLIFETWGIGVPRYRIEWAEGGHRRAAIWDAARAIARTAPWLVNDPTRSGWQILVAHRPPFVEVAIAPRDIDDPRFSWRRRDVPAASHPTIAAALARVAGLRDDDVVWDPFVGSGAELIERASLGSCRSLLGSDVDERALAAALENCTAAGLQATLQKADALTLRPRGVTLVLTNPPMGRRASRVPGVGDFLDRFVAHAAEVLRPGGRLVWIAPHPRRARKVGLSAGMHLRWARIVDMGGFEGEMQRWERPDGPAQGQQDGPAPVTRGRQPSRPTRRG